MNENIDNNENININEKNIFNKPNKEDININVDNLQIKIKILRLIISPKKN